MNDLRLINDEKIEDLKKELSYKSGILCLQSGYFGGPHLGFQSLNP